MPPFLKHTLTGLAAAMSVMLSGCDAGILEDGVPCDPSHSLTFRYDYNMLYTDIFNDAVTSIQVWGFDTDGRLAWTRSKEGAALARPDFSIGLDDIEPGTYTVVAWGGIGAGLRDRDFIVPDLEIGDHISDLTCSLYTEVPNVSDTDLKPLFFGRLENAVIHPKASEPRPGTLYNYEVPLLKNTNHIYIILRDERGKDITLDNFVYTLSESNGVMSHRNELLDSETISYTPWQQQIGVLQTRGSQPGQKVALADITTVRLMDERDNQLAIRGTDNVSIADFPLNDIILRYKELQYPGMSDQEFLDRQDEYVVELPVTDGRWLGAYLYINGWKIVLQDIDFEQ